MIIPDQVFTLFKKLTSWTYVRELAQYILAIIILNKALLPCSLHQWSLESKPVDWVDEPFLRF